MLTPAAAFGSNEGACKWYCTRSLRKKMGPRFDSTLHDSKCRQAQCAARMYAMNRSKLAPILLLSLLLVEHALGRWVVVQCRADLPGGFSYTHDRHVDTLTWALEPSRAWSGGARPQIVALTAPSSTLPIQDHFCVRKRQGEGLGQSVSRIRQSEH